MSWRRNVGPVGALLVVLLVTACGTQHAPGAPGAGQSAPAGGESGKAQVTECPQALPVVTAGPCATVSVEQNQQANQTFNSRIPLSATGAAEAAPVTQRIRQALERLSPAQRVQPAAVRTALLNGGMLSTDLVIIHGSASDGVGFGGYERVSANPPACAWGSVTAKAVDVESGGITREGGCLPTAGGH